MLEFLLFCGLIFLFIIIGNKVKDRKEAVRLAEINAALEKSYAERRFWAEFNASSPYNSKGLHDYKRWMKHRVKWYIGEYRYTLEEATRKSQQEFDSDEEKYFRLVCLSHYHTPTGLPDLKKWMEYRVPWYVKKGFTFEESSRKAQQEHDLTYEGDMSHSLTFHDHEMWMLYRVNWYITKKGLAHEEATRMAQKEFRKRVDEDGRSASASESYDNPVAIQTRFYENKGYTRSEAAQKARDDMS